LMIDEQRLEENTPVRKLWDHVDKCGADRKAEHGELEDSFEEHLRVRHHRPMAELLEGTILTPDLLVKSAIEFHEVLPGMADFLYGPPKIDPMTKTPLVDGNGRPLRDEKKGAQHAAHNGGFKADIPWGKIILAAITQAGAIIVAVIIVTGGGG